MNDFDLPNGWTDTTFGEIALVVSGGTPRAADNHNFSPSGEGIPWITPADLSKYTKKHISHGARDLSHAGYSTCSARLMPPGTVLLSSRAPIGYVAIAERPLSTNQGFKSFVLPDGLDSTYVFYYLKHIRGLAESLGTGTTFKELSLETTKKLPLRLAPREVQVAIGKFLDEGLNRVALARQRLDDAMESVRQLREAILAAAVRGQITAGWRDQGNAGASTAKDEVSQLGLLRIGKATSNAEKTRLESIYSSDDNPIGFELPATWMAANLEKLATTFDYGSSAKSQTRGSTPVLRMGNIRDGKLDWTELVYTSDTSEISQYRLKAGDVLFNRTNSAALVGKTAIFRGERDAIFAGYLIRVRTTSVLDPEYLNLCLNSFHGRDFSWRVKIDGVNQSNINASKLRQFPVPLAPLAEQHQIVKEVKRMLALADSIEDVIRRTQVTVSELEPAMLTRAFSGKLTDHVPFQQPAIDIVERISRARKVGEDIKLEGKSRFKRGANVAEKSTSSRRSIVEVLRQRKNRLTAGELFAALGFPSDSDVATVEEFFLEVRESILAGTISRQRLGNEDYFFLPTPEVAE